MRKFTQKEDDFLRENYLQIPAKRMAKMLNRSEGAARQRMKLLGIVVPADVVEKFKKESQYKKGRTPENKGKKMDEYVYEKVKATMFKKGQMPHNTKYDGHERISKDGYVEVRVSLGKYRLKHRVIWEQHFGEIPKGMLVVFKDRNPKNLSPDNLELITRKENMKRNTCHNYPKEIALTIQLRGVLNRQINKRIKQVK